ncbi:hypothetical protein JHK87_048121 [Glycine soja]|nr:hypothetical protein JHK87_048121 [Glycine soja]
MKRTSLKRKRRKRRRKNMKRTPSPSPRSLRSMQGKGGGTQITTTTLFARSYFQLNYCFVKSAHKFTDRHERIV